MKLALSFDDVLLKPQFSEISSRKDVDLTNDLDKNISRRLPIISSPMDTVTEVATAKEMSRSGGLGIIHRYNSIQDQAEMVRAVVSADCLVAAAVGICGDYLERARAVVEEGADIICLDVAHGHHIIMRHALEVLKNTFGSKIHIMAGNVATLQGFNALADWGADSVRVGIGGGSICSTRLQTGHGIPTFQSILDCSFSDRDATMIADGGIKNSGDIVKALAAGADFVMVGSLLAGTHEAPGEIMYDGKSKFKSYRGMASKEAQLKWRGHVSSIEGVTSRVPLAGTMQSVLSELETGIRSGLSYSGAFSIKQLQAKCSFIRQTSAGYLESSTHINER